MTTTRKIDGTAESRSNRLLGQRIALYRAAGLRLTESRPVRSFGRALVEQSWAIDF